MTDGRPPAAASRRALFQEFNAVNIGGRGSPIPGAGGINAQREAGYQRHIRWQNRFETRCLGETPRSPFHTAGMADRHKPAALVKISAPVGV